jgi:SAM-dependent methyltransferase
MSRELWPVEAATLSEGQGPDRPWDLVLALADDPKAIDRLEHASGRVLAAHDAPQLVARVFHDPMTSVGGELTTGRDYNVYARAFDEGAQRKWDLIAPHVVAGVIVDLGCGPGSLLAAASRDGRLYESDLHGVEVSRSLYQEALHRRAMNYFSNPHTFLHHANVLQPGLFAPQSVHTTLTVSLTHEIRSYGSDEDLRTLLRQIRRHTAPGGIYVNLDVCGPDDPDRRVILRFDAPANDSPETSIHALNAQGRWRRFVHDWQGPQAIWRQLDELRIQTTMRAAHEYVLHKDYPDNWDSEMHEEFGGWNFARWQAELVEAGWQVMPASRAYVNEWIVSNRLRELALLDADGRPLDWPVTNCLLVARAA